MIFCTQQHVDDMQCPDMASAHSVNFHAWAWPQQPIIKLKLARMLSPFAEWKHVFSEEELCIHIVMDTPTYKASSSPSLDSGDMQLVSNNNWTLHQRLHRASSKPTIVNGSLGEWKVNVDATFRWLKRGLTDGSRSLREREREREGKGSHHLRMT